LLLKNIYQAKRETIKECHSGMGHIEFSRIFTSKDFQTSIDFVDYAIIPPRSSIGFHQHLGNEEFYLVLQGTGKMRVGNEEFFVTPGDLIVNQDKSFHGLENYSDKEIHIFVVQVAKKSCSDENKFISYSNKDYLDKKVTIGIDIGATFTKVIEYSNSNVISFFQEPTPQFKSDTELITFIEQIMAKSKIPLSEVCGLGIGLCGMVDQIEGIFKSSSLFPEITDVPISKILNDRLGIPVLIDNDSNLAAIGEYTVGIAKGSKVLVALTLGTGVGAGIVINGNPFYGAHGYAGEFGHLFIDPNGSKCFCGATGCLNMLSSATALSNFYKSISGIPTDIKITADEIIKMLNNGDLAAKLALSKVCSYLGIAVANIISSFNPDFVVICGGLSNAGNPLLEEVREATKKHVLPELWSKTKIELSNLKEKAGAVGAAVSILERIRKNKNYWGGD